MTLNPTDPQAGEAKSAAERATWTAAVNELKDGLEATMRNPAVNHVVLSIDSAEQLLAAAAPAPARNQAEASDAEIQLQAWQEAFGTSQLTHAVARLQAAESTVARNQAEAGASDNEAIRHAAEAISRRFLVESENHGFAEAADSVEEIILESLAAAPSAAKGSDELHQQIMNLPCKPLTALQRAFGVRRISDSENAAYQEGHRDARHAAAELSLLARQQPADDGQGCEVCDAMFDALQHAKAALNDPKQFDAQAALRRVERVVQAERDRRAGAILGATR